MSIYFIVTIVFTMHSIFIKPAACSEIPTQQTQKISFISSIQAREQDLKSAIYLRDECNKILEQNPELTPQTIEDYRKRRDDLNAIVKVLTIRAL